MNNTGRNNMKIELKNFKHSAFASHETYCYEATVYIDGKKAFGANNDGCGACDSYYRLPKQSMSEFRETFKAFETALLTECKVCHGAGCIDCQPEVVIGNLITDMLIAKELKKMLKSRVLYTDGGPLYGVGVKGCRTVDHRVIDQVATKNPNAVVLNKLSFDEALTIYKEKATV